MTDKKNERLKRPYNSRRLYNVITFVLFLLIVLTFGAGFTLAMYTVSYYYTQVGFNIIIKSLIAVFSLFFILLLTFVIFYERRN